jgi:hypothetical protein
VTTPERDPALREHLQKVLDWDAAHATFDSAVEGIPPEKRGVAPARLPHSPWQILEHIRRTQWDILDFCRNPEYVEPKSMTEYWPDGPAPPSASAWDESVAAVRRDRGDLKKMAGDAKLDLFAKVPQGNGQTYLREVLLVADHTAYHVGQLVLTRRLLGIW